MNFRQNADLRNPSYSSQLRNPFIIHGKKG